MKIHEVCTEEVVTCEASATAAEAARSMREHHVGDLVVVEHVHGRKLPIGIVTDRDLVVSVMAKDVDPAGVRVDELIAPGIATVAADDHLDAGIGKMRAFGFRRMPVVSSTGELVGMVTLDDAIDALTAQLCSLTAVTRRQPAEERKRRR